MERLISLSKANTDMEDKVTKHAAVSTFVLGGCGGREDEKNQRPRAGCDLKVYIFIRS